MIKNNVPMIRRGESMAHLIFVIAFAFSMLLIKPINYLYSQQVSNSNPGVYLANYLKVRPKNLGPFSIEQGPTMTHYELLTINGFTKKRITGMWRGESIISDLRDKGNLSADFDVKREKIFVIITTYFEKDADGFPIPVRRFIDFGIFESGEDGHELEIFGTLDAIIYSRAGESSLQTYGDEIPLGYIGDYEWALEKAKNLVVLEKLASSVKGIRKN